MWAPEGSRGRLGPTQGLRASHHEEYAASVRRAFTPLAAGLFVAACQWPATGPTVGAGSSGSDLPEPDPCSVPGDAAAGAAAQESVARLELPERCADYRLDRCAPPVSYGELGSASLERACERVLGPGCRADERARLSRVVRFQYVNRAAAADHVEGILSRFEDAQSAYAHFTRVIVGESDPALLQATALDGGNLVQRGDGLYAWRGREVLWLRQADEGLTLAQREQQALAGLPRLARAVLAQLGDAEGLPPAVQQLPQLARIPLGVRLKLEDAFGVPGLGPSAHGYYQEGKKRWRVAALVRPDAESAQDVMSTLEHQAEARRIENAPLEALKLSERRSSSEAPLSWVIARRAEVVYGIGDEETVTSELAYASERASGGLGLQEKLSKLLGAHAQ
jgi:hypothetical protein